ncbi:MAG: AAA family ATPase [Oscillospiraceae bacterium]|nr:AAA family ATPase [Oscillospiraceae bacterium]
MGTYLNPSNRGFHQAVNSRIYIDKTPMIEILNSRLFTEEKCISVSHARRFGKSQAADMIEAYYSRGCDSRELFSTLEISKSPDFEKHLNKYNVLHLDISSFADDYSDDLVKQIKKHIFDELREKYPDVDYKKSTASVLQQIYCSSEEKYSFVIIIDEWDCVVRNFSDKPELVHEYLQFLHSLFKSKESKEFLALGYITGILPIKKIKDESALNNFDEYTMTDSGELTKYFGFTENEVKELCCKYDMNFDSVRAWYNGYLIDGMHMYNPNSVSQAMRKHKIKSYWKDTSAFDTINQFINLNFDGLKEDVITMLSGGKVDVNTNTFKNDLSVIGTKNEALTALIHLGYLGYDAERNKAYIPNYEVATAFQSALETGKWTEIAAAISECDKLLWATIDGEAEKVAELLELSHETYTSVLKYNNENALSCAITMAYFTAPAYYNVIRELPSGKGFADIAMIPRPDSGNKPPMIIELKYDKDADTAIKQIKEKRYDGSLRGYSDVLLVGVNYDVESKKHECIIEKFNME